MIKLTAFYPFEGFTKLTHEFYEDKVIIKKKSPTSEGEFEFQYKEIKEVSDAYYMPSGQYYFSFFLILMTALVFNLVPRFIYSHYGLHRLMQGIYIFAVILHAVSYMRSWYIIFSDKKGGYLFRLKQTRKNSELISEIIEIIKRCSEINQEISLTNPFPEKKPNFEHVEYNISNLSKTTERFYENQILGVKKDFSGDYIYSIKYNQLNGKTLRVKVGIDAWGLVLTFSTLIILIVSGFSYAFRINFGIAFLYTIYILISILVVSFMLKFVKREAVGLEGIDGDIEHWFWINKSNKEKIEKIIKFVQSKIPDENKDKPSP